MSVANALTFQRQAEESPAWALLRSPLAPVIAGVLSSIFSTDRRQIAGSIVIEELDELLIDLREVGFDLPRSAGGYITDWVKAGYLIRRSPRGEREEYYELSREAIDALDYVKRLSAPRKSATRSRLATVIDQLDILAIETDSDEAKVLARLEEEKQELERRIAAVRERGVDVVSHEDAVEHVENILSLVADIPGDFARVRQATEEIDQTLREQLVRNEVSAREVLENVFRGVDLIQDSDEGKSFNGFYELLFDREQSAQLEQTLDDILGRPFIERLSEAEQARLRWVMRDLEGHAEEVHTALLQLSRSLRRFVQSREVEAQQELAKRITSAQSLALRVGAKINPSTKLATEIELTGRQFSSISTWQLKDPAESRIEEDMVIAEQGSYSLEELRRRVRESEIDWEELRENLRLSLERRGAATVSDVLEDYPATQGLASIVGLISLAIEGAQRVTGTDRVRWINTEGQARAAQIPLFVFGSEVENGN